jgi:flagellar biosynthetic protein FliR
MTLSEPEIGAIIAAISRVGGLAATAPVIGEQGVPLRARLAFVILVGGAIGINRPGVMYADVPPVAILELAVGLMTGLVSRFIMARVAVAGQLVGLSLGLGFASQFDVRAGESAGTVRMLFTTLAGLAFLYVGGLEAIVRSAATPAHPAHVFMLGPELLRAGASAFGFGLSLAAPLVLAALVGNIGFAMMNRAAPAMNVFSIALAGVLILGGVILMSTAGTLIANLTDTARASAEALM